MQEKNETVTRARPETNINRIAQNKNLTYFAVGFSVISLTISKPMLEIRLQSMQQTELRLKCLIIIGRSKVSPIVSPKNSSDHVTQHVGIQNFTPQLDIIVDKMKSFDYKNQKITALRNSIIPPL